MSLFKKKIKAEIKESVVKPTSGSLAQAGASMQELYAAGPQAVDGKPGEKRVAGAFNRAYAVLLKPLVTEKATDLGKLNQYVFAVAKDANKISVAKAVWQLYGVKPIRVNLLNQRGKAVSRGRISGRRRDWKKAVVTLPAGKQIS